MSLGDPLSENEILKISRRTIDIIQTQITSNVCLFGSAAAYLWADIGRVPKVACPSPASLAYLLPTQDIDIVVSHGSDPEWIKRAIVNADDRYYLKRSIFPNAPYKILYCRLPGFRAHGRRVKVDILVPPSDLGLPDYDSLETPVIDDLPVMPLFDLLVMKTQGWQDHRTEEREDLRAKVKVDVTDIDALLDRAIQEDVSYQDEIDSYRLPSEFMDWALTLARMFARRHGRWGKWRAIGFPL